MKTWVIMSQRASNPTIFNRESTVHFQIQFKRRHLIFNAVKRITHPLLKPFQNIRQTDKSV